MSMVEMVSMVRTMASEVGLDMFGCRFDGADLLTGARL